MKKPELNLDKVYKLFIGGEWVEAEDKETLNSFSPADGSLLAEISEATRADVDKAVDAAWKAFESYRHTTPKERAKILNEIADIIDANKEHLVQ